VWYDSYMKSIVRIVAMTLFVSGLFVVSTQFVSASGLPDRIVPCSGPDCDVCSLVALGQNIFNFLIFFSLIFATLLFINAGALYLFSPANPANISKAHRIFTNTLVGILIILCSWLIVNTVMQNLYDSDEGWGPWNQILCRPGAATAIPPAVPPTAPTGAVSCTSIQPLPTLSDPLAVQLENAAHSGGSTVIWTNTDPRLRTCAESFANAVGGRVTSAYRPTEYQSHLRAIYDRWCIQNLRSSTDPECSDLRTDVQRHVNAHFGSNWNCGSVGVTSRHTSGTGVDIGGISNYSAVANQALSYCLRWQDYPGDPYHFDLIAGCSC